MKLSIIIPAYNEKNTILEILKRIESVNLNLEKEIIIVDDHSTDGTIDILKKLNGSQYKIIFKDKNEGKGAAIKSGLMQTQGEFVIFQDADIEYDPRDYPAMIQPILDGKTEVVLGVRIKPEQNERRRKSLYWLSFIGNKLITWTTNLLFWNNAGEYESCYKAFTKRLLDVRDDVEHQLFAFVFGHVRRLCQLEKRFTMSAELIPSIPKELLRMASTRFACTGLFRTRFGTAHLSSRSSTLMAG